MERYAPKLMELAPRDMVSRAIVPGDPRRARHRRQGLRLPRRPPPRPQDDRREAARHHGLRPGLPGHRAATRSPIPIQPTAHYAMGGIPTDMLTPGRRATRRTPSCPGLYAAGEAACVSRPRREPPRARTRSWTCWSSAGGPGARWRATSGAGTCRRSPTDVDGAGPRRARGDPRPRRGRARAQALRRELADVMMDDVGVYRDAAGLERAPRQGRRAARPLRAASSVDDKGTRLQHRPARGARGGLPARLRRDDGRGRARPQGEPRRPQPRGLPGPRRRQLPDPLASRRRARTARSSWPTSR